jgi:hypothetical protein
MNFDALEDAFMAPLLKLLARMIWQPLEYTATDEGYPMSYAIAAYGPLAGIPSLETCDICSGIKAVGYPCPSCAPTGMVKCPASLRGEQQHNKPKCRLCKGSGFVEAL